jgi:phosphoglycolate phosphatase-like HAD superfamily hydrolase
MTALYFDLDGTLVNSQKCCVVSTQETFRKFFALELTAEQVIENMGVPIEVTFREWSDGKIHDGNWDEVAGHFRAAYKINSPNYSTLFDGVADFLGGLRVKTDNLFVVTSKKSAAAEADLSNMNILGHFRGVIGSDRVDHYKPHPDPIYKARAMMGDYTPSFEMMIGDADTDIFTGKGAGIKTCAVTWGAHDKARLLASNPDYVANDVNELAEIIHSAMAGGR